MNWAAQLIESAFGVADDLSFVLFADFPDIHLLRGDSTVNVSYTHASPRFAQINN